MNIVFLGSSDYGRPSLKALVRQGENISCVITQPDKKQGRGLHFDSTSIKKLALELGLKVYQPQDINNAGSVEILKGLKPDLIVVIAYGQILSDEVLNIPQIMPVNIHASLLPRYRGAAPINWAIIKNEKKTGNSLIKIARKMDSGPIILQKEISIDEGEDAQTLELKMSEDAALLLLDGLEKIKKKDFNLLEQDEQEVTFAPKLRKNNGLIDWDSPARQINNLIRGCIPWPVAYTIYNGKILRVLKAQIQDKLDSSFVQPGQIVKIAREGITVRAKDGHLLIGSVQLEGKKVISAWDFACGQRLTAGKKLSNLSQDNEQK